MFFGSSGKREQLSISLQAIILFPLRSHIANQRVLSRKNSGSITEELGFYHGRTRVRCLYGQRPFQRERKSWEVPGSHCFSMSPQTCMRVRTKSRGAHIMLASAPLPAPAVKVDKVCTISRGCYCCCGGQTLFFRPNVAVVLILLLS
jgi:hypothetical protein